MKRVLVTLAAVVATGLAGAVLVVWLGLYNVSARAGHLPGIGWVLNAAYDNSVRLRAPPEDEVPDLSDPALIALGAGHYATACVPCHAKPGDSRTATMRAMLPEPPPIREALANWEPAELHWIVRNGIKMSGMPAWPAADRGDEVWAVVAYLAAIQRGEEPPLRVTATFGQGAEGSAYCTTCHGSIPGRVPRLDIQSPEYLAGALEDFRSGVRPSGFMQHAVSLVPPEEFADLAEFFASEPETARPSPDASPEGERLARRGTRDVPACASCHGPDAPDEATAAPVLAGQDRAYLENQLRLWRNGTRQGSATMSAAAQDLTDDDIALLSAWYSGLGLEWSETD